MSEEDPQSPRMLFEFLLHESENLHSRVDWFLIFNAILFEAFFAAHNQHRIVIGLLGSLISYVWLAAGIRQLWNIGHLVEIIRNEEIMGYETGKVFAQFYAGRWETQKWWMSWASSNPAFSGVIPLAVLSVWLYLSATASGQFSCPVLLTAFLVIIAGTAFWYVASYVNKTMKTTQLKAVADLAAAVKERPTNTM